MAFGCGVGSTPRGRLVCRLFFKMRGYWLNVFFTCLVLYFVYRFLRNVFLTTALRWYGCQSIISDGVYQFSFKCQS